MSGKSNDEKNRDPIEQSRFASSGARKARHSKALPIVAMSDHPGSQPLQRIQAGDFFRTSSGTTLREILNDHDQPAPVADEPPPPGLSAGKNTYTYDAHTYHTKVPPQGVARLIRHYLPDGGLVLDPFAGSGMTAVGASAVGVDAILNELGTAPSFIASQFLSQVPSEQLLAAVAQIMSILANLRNSLYSTECRECGSTAELLYTVWSYRVNCSTCDHNFQLWDTCRSYGTTVREHKILSEFNCPKCHALLKKSRLTRTTAEPVQVAYKCCGSKMREVTHPPTEDDLAIIRQAAAEHPPAEGFYPHVNIPNGVNLNQPKNHGFTTIASLYTDRALTIASHIWREISKIEDDDVCAIAAFAFTGMYRRITRLSEFRFWGGSGNSPRLNVPYIFEESNIFKVFERKAHAIADHLESTSEIYSGRAVVHRGSATSMPWLPDDSVDLVFTDPPFGSNINYSEMNLLWEAWLGGFTDPSNEAIVNKFQGKGVEEYGQLMKRSLLEAHRVLRPGGWLLMMFMNSSARVWEQLRSAIDASGFEIVSSSIFDKKHGTFKHYVSENTAGADLVLHCRPRLNASIASVASESKVQYVEEIYRFLDGVDLTDYNVAFQHVKRVDETDYRRMYSEWLAHSMSDRIPFVDFRMFREIVMSYFSLQTSQDRLF
ncbi:hypothetical protein ND991_21870 [Gordonia sputi]|uniref:DNA methyltransferase n=1 Tax=Gordonia sputi TaxID=36823 RepID=UPI002044C6FB|nr:DNA methyltransferase [Gordonia sputi]MCM3897853.1 hypothetical protein [Gordonia sputi]